ncbi:MAG: acetoacetate decarboxylase family protein [Acidobacteria bacterium]|nr:acetoacetate decarboxylase family protein [Acidobacteriota bacterium]
MKPGNLKPGDVQYEFRHAIGGFFEFPTENARKLLPPHLHPVEPHHGQSVLSVMAFDFTGSSTGPYGELVLSVHVAPRIEAGRPMARAAFYPFLVGTTTGTSRESAIKLWHLPHFMHDIEIAFTTTDHDIAVAAAHGGTPILDMRITDYQWEDVEHHYQAFTHDATGSYMASMRMNARFSENEEERGSIEIHAHEFAAGLDRDGVNTTPFRELWMRDGLQTFQPLETMTPGAR